MIGRVALLAVAGTLVLGGCQLLALGRVGPATCVTLQVGPIDGVPVSDAQLEATREVIGHRLDALGAGNASFAVVHPDQHMVVGLPAGDATRWQRAMEQPGELSFVPVPPELSQQVVDGQPLPSGIDPTPIFDGTGVAELDASEDELGRPAIALSLEPEAAALFDAYAAAHYGERFAIVVDGVVLSAPSINAPRFGGRAQISGNFEVSEMEDLIAVVGSGPLPAPVRAVGVQDPVGGGC